MISVNQKYGCLVVLDMGEEYLCTERYLENKHRYETLMAENEQLEALANSHNQEQKRSQILQSNSCSWAWELEKNPENIDEIFSSFAAFHIRWNKREMTELSPSFETHYKCQCKCGQIHYYNQYTLESNPKYCAYPVSISTKHTYSVAAQNARGRKAHKYHGLENVQLLDSSQCVPSAQYCETWNKYKQRQLQKKEEKLQEEISRIPRVYAKNYNEDFVGRQYESLYIEKCTNEYLESTPQYSFSQSHKKHWHNITVFKQYKCKCLMCGKEHEVTCDKFGIFPPTQYGRHAYNGYWSEVCCDCHPISSFQWIVNKILFEHNVPYQPEYEFPDLYGAKQKSLLRFDFAIFDETGQITHLIECQGEQHYQPIDEFGGQSQFELQKQNDALKREYARSNDITLIEIPYQQKQHDKIVAILQQQNII